MKLPKIGLAVCLIASATSPCLAEATDLTPYLDAGGGLSNRLVLEDSQSGFAGVTSDVWTIEPDGSFTIERRLDGKPIAPARTGTLSAEGLESIAAAMLAQDFQSFPEEAGTGDKVNARSVTLTFGDQTSVLWLPAGRDMKQLACSAPRSSNLGGAATVTAAIIDTLGTLDKAAPASGDRECEQP
jgi:hypothetical protein